MKMMNSLYFGTAGVPLSTKDKSTEGGIIEVHRLGLDAMELEFVRGVRMSLSRAREVGKIAESLKIVLTAHAPYYINLLSGEEEKVEASIKRILDTARVAYEAKGYSIVFHAAYYGRVFKEEAYKLVRDRVRSVVKILTNEGVRIWVRPETTGKASQFGDLEETIRLSEDIEGVLPCVDFSHIHARFNGKFNTYEEFSQILTEIERRLGREALNNMHMHFSGIEYGKSGEIRHLNLEESDFEYRSLARCWKDFNVRGVAISESPNIEKDAILMKSVYKSLS